MLLDEPDRETQELRGRTARAMIDRRRAAEKAEGSEIEAPDLEWRDPSAGPGPGGGHLAALFSLESLR